MSKLRDIRRDDGGVLVASAIILAALVFLSVGIIQVGAWFQDRRHLQVRADAGALAGGQLFNQCFDTAAFTAAQAKANMEKKASQYAGFSSYNGTALAGSFTPAYNNSFSTGSNSIAFQSTTYPGSGGGGTPDDTNTGNECDSGNLAIDVKMTRNVGGFFTISPLGHVHAHARVQLKEIQSVVPTFPLAVPELVPGVVAVTFINEDTGAELTGCTGTLLTGTTCTYTLANTNTTPGSDPFNLGPWEITGAGVNLPAFAGASPVVTHIGMRIGVGDPASEASCANSAGNGSSWECFNNTATGQGTVVIDEVNPSAAIAIPRLQGLWTSTCSGTPFDGDEITNPNPCWASVTAKAVSTGLGNFRLRATITQNGGGSVTSPDLTLNAGLYTWPAPLPTVNINPSTGASDYTVQLCWKDGNGSGGFTCPASWTHRVVGATDNDDGPIANVALTDPSAPVSPYSYNSSGVKTMTIDVKLKAPFNKLTILRQSHSGSATAFILCRWKDPNNPSAGVENGLPGITAALASGCQVPYQVNGAIPPTCTPDPLPSPQNILNPDCTQNKPSSSMGNQITNSLDTRFGCTKGADAVHPNLWPDYSEPGDTRAVTLITTTYDAFAHNGNNQYPVTGFGAFYIAGVSGNSCQEPGPPTTTVPASTTDVWPPALGPEPGKNSGTIWGYFIKYTNLDGTPSGRACKVNSLNNCVAVLTR